MFALMCMDRQAKRLVLTPLGRLPDRPPHTALFFPTFERAHQLKDSGATSTELPRSGATTLSSTTGQTSSIRELQVSSVGTLSARRTTEGSTSFRPLGERLGTPTKFDSRAK